MISLPGTGIPDIYNVIQTAASTGLISDEAGKSFWGAVKYQAINTLDEMRKSGVPIEVISKLDKDIAFIREH